jgi:hypothetical protein
MNKDLHHKELLCIFIVMNLQENIERIHEIMGGVITEGDNKLIDLGVKLLRNGYYGTQKAIENVNSDEVYYLYQGRTLIKYNKKFKLARVKPELWDELENYLGADTLQIQKIFKIWLEDYFDLEIGQINERIAIVKYV